MILMAFTFYMVYRLLSDYFQYNSYNKSSTEWKDNVTLPAISICSTNPINYTALVAELSANESTEDLLTQFDYVMGQLERFKGEGSIWDSLDMATFINLGVWETQKGSIVAKFGNDISSTTVGPYHYLIEKTLLFYKFSVVQLQHLLKQLAPLVLA